MCTYLTEHRCTRIRVGFDFIFLCLLRTLKCFRNECRLEKEKNLTHP